MKFLKTRTTTKFHTSLRTLTTSSTPPHTLLPVTLTSGPFNTDTLFPYSAAQSLTKTFLGRNHAKNPQAETDARLLALIRGHERTEVAFAACAAFMSIEAVRAFLEGEDWQTGDGGVTGVESWLQCFVAAAYSKSFDFARGDHSFAVVMVAVAADVAVAQASTLHLLLSAWRQGAPRDAGLLERAAALTATVLHCVAEHLEELGRGRMWTEANAYVAQLRQFGEVFDGAGPVFRECVNASLPCWRCWVGWEVDGRMIDPARKQLLMRDGTFACLWELEGPNFAEGQDFAATAWKGYIRRGWMVQWLEAQGFNIGIGLIVGDSEELLVEFMGEFRQIVDVALDDGPLSTKLLKMYIEREGLDTSSLNAWHDARRSLVLPLPKFVEYIVEPKAQADNDDEIDFAVISALDALRSSALNPPACEAVRRPILAEIAQTVQLACNKLDTDLRICTPLVSIQYEWLVPALRLWHLRESLVSSTWLHSSVEHRLLTISQAQPSTISLQILEQLQTRVRSISDAPLLSTLNEYVERYITIDNASVQPLAHALHLLWIQTIDHARREAALTVATFHEISAEIRSACIVTLAHATSIAAEQLEDRLLQVKARVRAAYIDLTDVIVRFTGVAQNDVCWAALLWSLLKADAVLVDGRTFTDCGSKQYIQWIRHLHSLSGGPGSSFAGTLTSLDEIVFWLPNLERLEPVLQTLDAMGGSKKAMHLLLTTTDIHTCAWHLRLLRDISAEVGAERKEFMLDLLLCLTGENARAICLAAELAARLELADFRRVRSFFELAKANADLATARLAIHLNMREFSETVKDVLTQIGQMLGLKEGSAAWSTAKKEFDFEVKKLMERAQKLEHTRTALMRSKRRETEKMMRELEFEFPDGVATLMLDLPAELADVVQDVGEDQLELHFSLNGLHSLTKLALGVKGTETVVVTLRVLGDGVTDAYCVHLEESVSVAASSTKTHAWTEMEGLKVAPTRFVCGRAQSRLLQVVARAVWRELVKGEHVVEKLYERVKKTIQNGANECMICAQDIGARLHRATTCGSMLCTLTNEHDFGVRVEVVRHDARVLDLLLTTVYAVATAKKLDVLLPGRPVMLGDETKLLALLNALPSTEALAKAADMHASLRLAGKHADLLVSWLCNASRSYIISATGDWRIPNMPGIHQFLVVDNAPQIEAAFAKHNHLQPRMVLFHGTSMDRLYAILTQGLKVLSNTPLQKNGAVHGAGIYFSTDTSLPAGYAAGTGPAAGAPAFFRSRGDFDGPGVLLGCEHAGPTTGPTKKGGIFVVTDPTKVIVRYVFLVPQGINVPVAKDIIGPMIGSFYSLRSCAAASN